jgi:hypothetical protein
VNRRTAVPLLALPLVAAVLAGCGSTSSSEPMATHVMSDGRTMSGSAMPGMSGMAGTGAGAGAPSATASMVCGDEIRRAVAHTLTLPSAPRGLHSWADRVFRCSYLLRAGELRLSVKDLDTAGPGTAYFDGLRARLPGASNLRGVLALGLPSFETARGDVVFLKDDKTLWVDASRLSSSGLPRGMSREDVAYGVAAAVIACWSE